jgi:hypothetical protein
MAEITDQEKIDFYEEAHGLAEKASNIDLILVRLRDDGGLRLDPTRVQLPPQNAFRNEVLAMVRRIRPGMAVGIVLGDDGQPKILPNPLPAQEGPFVA